MVRGDDSGDVFPNLRPTTRDAMVAAGATRRTRRGSHLFREGERSTTVYLVRTGTLKVMKSAPDGRELIIGLRGPGQFLGEMGAIGDLRRSATVVALVDSELSVWTRGAFLDLLDTKPDLAISMLQSLSGRVRRLLTKLVEFATADAATRVAGYLLTFVPDDALSDAHDSLRRDGRHEPIRVDLPYSQAELAATAGLARESVVKALAGMRQAGLLSTGRKRVTILDLEGLQALTGADILSS